MLRYVSPTLSRFNAASLARKELTLKASKVLIPQECNRFFSAEVSSSSGGASESLRDSATVGKSLRAVIQKTPKLQGMHQLSTVAATSTEDDHWPKIHQCANLAAAIVDGSTSIKERIGDLRVLLLANSFNSMTQRAYLELKDTYDQDVRIEVAIAETQMIDAVKRHYPDVILCPFLTKRIPEEIWKDTSRLCLVVHPGIHGDRGASSIDWALKDKQPEWGVTVLQADEEMDAGDIWSSKNFPVPQDTTKSVMYSTSVIDAAMEAIHDSMGKIVTGEKGIPLDYSDPSVKGTLRENMKISERAVDFNDSASNVASAIHLSDSAPGAPYTIDGHKVFLYGAHVDNSVSMGTTPGMITGKRHGAVRITCAEGTVWVTHMKGRGKDCELPRVKLPATDVLPKELTADVPELTEPERVFGNGISEREAGDWRDMWASISDSGAAVIHFPFLNGAMSTSQCTRLTAFFEDTCARDDVKTVILAGGYSNWSNGINLNTIEASNDPVQESWENINAINDFVKAVFSTEKVTIAALQGNAGAGGAMTALACDFVWAHGKTVLNPHYKSMGLHGSEYWTYFLPKRVGHDMARELTEHCMPVSAATAKSLGMVDGILTEDRTTFMEEVNRRGDILAQDEELLEKIRSLKKEERTKQWYEDLEGARKHELRIMRENFVNTEYVRARKNFVHKINPTDTPLHLSLDHYRSQAAGASDPSLINYSAARLMNGTKVRKLHLESLAKKIVSLKASHGTVPKLAVVIVSGSADAERYVQQKTKAAKGVGVLSEVHRFENNGEATDLEEQLINRIKLLNDASETNGIMVQLPLPEGVDKFKVLAAVCPRKDIDGFAPANLGGLGLLGGGTGNESPYFTPCTAKGILALLDYYGVSVAGKHVCVIGRSCLVGLPTQLCLMDRGATVTSCDINTTNLRELVQSSDVVVASAGSPNIVKADWVKPGAVVVDVGFHVMEEWCDSSGQRVQRIVGDVDIEARQVASLITPVPGGVGPMTVTMLLENTVEAFLYQMEKQ